MHALLTSHGDLYRLYRERTEGLPHVQTSDLVGLPGARRLRAWPLTVLGDTGPDHLPTTREALAIALHDWADELEAMSVAGRLLTSAPTEHVAEPGRAGIADATYSPFRRATATVRHHRAQPYYMRAGHTRHYWNGHAGGGGLRRFG